MHYCRVNKNEGNQLNLLSCVKRIFRSSYNTQKKPLNIIMSMKKKSGTLPPIHPRAESQDDMNMTGYENPFKLPNDDKIFKLREEEKQKKLESRAKNMTLTIWEKSATEVQSQNARLQEIVGDENVKTLAEIQKKHEETLKLSGPRRQEKENMTEFVAKKREMFLVQMSLDTKRDEIRKLEEKAQMKEDALRRSENLLEEDAMRFDAFLKENDKKAHDAIKKAEEETKRKQEKTQEIKRLTQQIQALSSEMSKHKEALEDCLRYKKFLDMLTPPEWFAKHAQAHQDKINRIKKERFDVKYKEWERLKRRIMEQHRREVEARKEAKREKNRKAGRPLDEDEDDEPESRPVIPHPPKIEDEIVEIPEEDPPMYFTEPHQLMDIFAALEEQNLFLIQNSQETERTLEELQHAFKNTKIQMDTRTTLLNQQIEELNSQIAQEEQKIHMLMARKASSGSSTMTAETAALAAAVADVSQHEKEALLNDLNTKVRQVYEQCVASASSRSDTLMMLSQMESRLESLLAEVEQLPVEYVIKSEKEKEKRRRERKREEQQALLERTQEERNRRAIERSLQAPKKRTGRQVMYRSKPIRKENKTIGDEKDNTDNDMEMKFLM